MAVSRREMRPPADIATHASSSADPVPAGGRLPEELDEGQRASFHPNTTPVDAGFFTWEIETGEVICDPVTFRMHGLPEDGPATMDHFLSRVPPSDLAQLLRVMEQMVASNGNYQIEYRILAPDGSMRSMEARGRILQGPDGRPGRMIGLVTDTTATRNAREAEKRRLRNFAASPLALAATMSAMTKSSISFRRTRWRAATVPMPPAPNSTMRMVSLPVGRGTAGRPSKGFAGPSEGAGRSGGGRRPPGR